MVEEKEVEEIAENARINLSQKEIENFVTEFDDILSIFKKLEKINTDEVEPAFIPIDIENNTRKDQTEAALDKDQVFKNSENKEDNFFKGPSA